MADTHPTLYVLAGFDHNGSFKDITADFEKRSDVRLIRPQSRQSIEDAIKAIDTTHGNVSIYLACHGGEKGDFDWNKNESVNYSELFKALPDKDISSIMIGGCYGGTAERIANIQDLPSGTVLQSGVSSLTPSYSFETADAEFANKIQGNKNPADMLIANLGRVDPVKVAYMNQTSNADINSDLPESKPGNPNFMLPHTLVIGGYPPQRVDLDQEINAIVASAKGGTLDKQTFTDAVNAVHQSFGTGDHFDPKTSYLPQNSFASITSSVKDFFVPKSKGEEINEIAERMLKGENQSPTAEVDRIRYAITIANMDKTKRFDQIIAQQRATPRHGFAVPALSLSVDANGHLNAQGRALVKQTVQNHVHKEKEDLSAITGAAQLLLDQGKVPLEKFVHDHPEGKIMDPKYKDDPSVIAYKLLIAKRTSLETGEAPAILALDRKVDTVLNSSWLAHVNKSDVIDLRVDLEKKIIDQAYGINAFFPYAHPIASEITHDNTTAPHAAVSGAIPYAAIPKSQGDQPLSLEVNSPHPTPLEKAFKLYNAALVKAGYVHEQLKDAEIKHIENNTSNIGREIEWINAGTADLARLYDRNTDRVIVSAESTSLWNHLKALAAGNTDIKTRENLDYSSAFMKFKNALIGKDTLNPEQLAALTHKIELHAEGTLGTMASPAVGKPHSTTNKTI